MLATAEQIRESWKDPDFKPALRVALGMTSTQNLTETVINRFIHNSAETFLAHHMLGKGTRPWELVNLTKGLDTDQIWIGTEFETGFDLELTYQVMARYVINNFNNTVIDYEGCGDYEAEFTFPPVNIEDFVKDDYFLDKLLTYADNNSLSFADHDHSDMVGFHVNFSTPTTRGMDYEDHQKLARLITGSIDALSSSQKRDLFGREPYGYIYPRSDTHDNYWFEAKLFDASVDVDVIREYKKKAHRLALLMEQVASEDGASRVVKVKSTEYWRSDYYRAKYRIKNIENILNGIDEPDEIEWTEASITSEAYDY